MCVHWQIQLLNTKNKLNPNVLLEIQKNALNNYNLT